ncbi:MAG: universal stress protein [Bacteroidia bacterium]
MNKIKNHKILVPIDFSDVSMSALKHAGTIAQILNGELLLLYVQKKKELFDIIFPAIKQGNMDMVTGFLSEKLEEVAGKVRVEYGIKITTIVSQGNVTSEIVAIAEENKAGLIIMGTSGNDSTHDKFLGSNSYRVLTKSSIPVITTHSGIDKASYKKILIPIDTSEHTRQKADTAIYLAEKFGAELHAIGVLGLREADYEYKMEVILGQISSLAKKKNVTCVTSIHSSPNRVETTLSHAKKINAGLVIIMTDQHTEFSHAILGTYAHQLINESAIPVLCIPPELHPENIPSDSIGGMW